MAHPHQIAQLVDADTTVTLYKKATGYHVAAIRDDGTSPAYVVYAADVDSLSEAMKAVMVFFVGEWESVFHRNALHDKLVEAIQAR